jgi:hypothetical protein
MYIQYISRAYYVPIHDGVVLLFVLDTVELSNKVYEKSKE